jgi:hypothetical protein
MEGKRRKRKQKLIPARIIAAAVLAILAIYGYVKTEAHFAQHRNFGQPHLLVSITDPRVKESSGVAPSQIYPNVFYTFNDSGDTARFFQFNRTGKVLHVFNVTNGNNVDWEDMSSAKLDGKPFLFFGDIGDNSGVRPSIAIYRVPEPGNSTGVKADQIYTLHYPDGSHNAETLLVNPKSGDIMIVTKAARHPQGIYFLPRPHASGSWTLKKLADIEVNANMRSAKLITGGAWSQDGKYVVLRTYFGAFEFSGNDPRHWFETDPTRIKTNLEMQGEGITYTLNGGALITTSEGTPCPVSEIPIAK